MSEIEELDFYKDELKRVDEILDKLDSFLGSMLLISDGDYKRAIEDIIEYLTKLKDINLID